MEQLDLIGIGALNFDYMFHCSRTPSTISQYSAGIDNSSEDLNWTVEQVEEAITQFSQSKYTSCTTQIGGSAFLALKGAISVDSTLNIGYVSVCGDYNYFDRVNKKTIDLSHALSFINNRDWLFDASSENISEKCIGKTVTALVKNERNNIGVFSGANNELLRLIEQKNQETSFVDYLVQARWIHISSLTDITQWMKIMDYVLLAKEKNNHLKISIDPGNEYTKKHKKEIQKYLQAADFIFLSTTEKENLSASPTIMDENTILSMLSDYFGTSPKVLVVKYKNKHELIDCSRGIPFVYYHTQLNTNKIMNDTGAGDFFAGGFIAGMLSDRLLAQQPAPIDLGNIASTARMSENDIDRAVEKARADAEAYYSQKYVEGTLNRRQKRRLFFQKTENIIYGFIVSFITGILGTVLVEWVLKLIQ